MSTVFDQDRNEGGLPALAIMLVLIVALVIDIDLALWQERDRVIEHDVHGYYAYLPALFIYDDIKLVKSEYREGDYYYFWPNYTPEGHRLIKYTVGSAIMYAPFFFIADIIAAPLGYARSGFSLPYKLALLVNALFYLGAGLFLIRLILLRSGTSGAISALVIVCIGLGTNLLCYATANGAMPHVHGFFLVTAIMLLSSKWLEDPNNWNSVLLGLVIGLAVLVRPALVIYSVIPFLFMLSNEQRPYPQLKRRIKRIGLMALAAFCTLLPQFIYWHEVTGSWIYYSYQDEGFFWGHPVIQRGLFGFRKGWLIYTPMMLFSVIGLFMMKNGSRKVIIPVVALHIYITFSWWCWWYGGTFGQRAMIETYGVLSIPMAAAFSWLMKRSALVRVSAFIMIFFLIFLNIFQMYQYEEGSIHYEAMTREAYQAQFLRMQKVQGFEQMLDYPDYEAAKKGLAR